MTKLCANMDVSVSFKYLEQSFLKFLCLYCTRYGASRPHIEVIAKSNIKVHNFCPLCNFICRIVRSDNMTNMLIFFLKKM